MQGFTFIPYTYQATNSDFAVDVGDKFDITDTNDEKYLTYIMNNSWEFTGAVRQNWQAKGENELNNTYSSKGPIGQQIENIVKEQIPNARQEAINKATELLTEFNGGYVVKKDGELFISDNEDIDKAQHIWRWNINGLGYSSTGIDGPYGLAMTMDGKIVADFITTGTMSAERINGGTLKLGGNNNTNGSIQVVNANGNDLVTISKDGVVLSNGTKLIGNGGVLSNFQFLGTCHKLELSTYGKLDFLGVISNQLDGVNTKNFIDIYADIPAGFTITEAYITLIHQPVIYSSGSSNFYGYSRSLGLYEGNPASNIWATIGGEYYENSDATSEIIGAFGELGFTPSIPSSTNLKIETKKSINLKDYLIAGKLNRLVIQSRNDVPSFTGEYITDEINCAKERGRVLAILEIYGYLN